MKLTRSFAWIFGTITAASTAYAGIFDLKVRHYGIYHDARDCNNEKATVAAEFERTSGAKVVSAICSPAHNIDSASLTLTYTAQQAVKIWDSEAESLRRDNLADIFDTFSECEASRAEELTFMRSLTGLEPFLSKCYVTSIVGSQLYRHRILAAGESTWKRVDSAAVAYKKYVYTPKLLTDLAKLAEDFEIKVTRWSELPVSTTDQLNVQFYAQYNSPDFYPSLTSTSSGRVGTSAQCQGYLTAVRERLSANAASRAYPDCLQISGGTDYALVLFWWGTTFDERIKKYKFKTVSEDYGSRSACQETADRLSRELKDEPSFVGVVCSHDRGQWRIEMLSDQS